MRSASMAWRSAMYSSPLARAEDGAQRNAVALADVLLVQRAKHSQNAAHAGGERGFGLHAVVGQSKLCTAWVKRSTT
jgi:hypothetical protein